MEKEKIVVDGHTMVLDIRSVGEYINNDGDTKQENVRGAIYYSHIVKERKNRRVLISMGIIGFVVGILYFVVR